MNAETIAKEAVELMEGDSELSDISKETALILAAISLAADEIVGAINYAVESFSS